MPVCVPVCVCCHIRWCVARYPTLCRSPTKVLLRRIQTTFAANQFASWASVGAHILFDIWTQLHVQCRCYYGIERPLTQPLLICPRTPGSVIGRHCAESVNRFWLETLNYSGVGQTSEQLRGCCSHHRRIPQQLIHRTPATIRYAVLKVCLPKYSP